MRTRIIGKQITITISYNPVFQASTKAFQFLLVIMFHCLEHLIIEHLVIEKRYKSYKFKTRNCDQFEVNVQVTTG